MREERTFLKPLERYAREVHVEYYSALAFAVSLPEAIASRVCSWRSVMYSSKRERSIRHWLRPPIWMAGSSPLRTRARTCESETCSSSATSLRVRKRGAVIELFLSVSEILGPLATVSGLLHRVHTEHLLSTFSICHHRKICSQKALYELKSYLITPSKGARLKNIS